ncbi:MAG: efflux RND transporter periplasmic adaptor subunit [bacterium]|nr:efflux RND transporter periplasmic adaptor subunit [bacterium]
MKLIKNLLIIVGGCAVLALLLMWMVGSFNERVQPGLEESPVPDLSAVTTVKAAYRSLDQTAEAVGSIQSRSTTNIASKIMASIRTIAVRPGDAVKQGQLLVTLDDRDLQSRLDQARRGLEAAKAAYDQAKIDKDRYEKLLRDRSVPQTQYDNMASAERIAMARYQQAQEAVTEAEVMLSYAKIYSTMSGTITEKFADPGNIATPGQPILTMYDPNNMRVEVAVREQLTNRLKIGQSVNVVIDAINKQLDGTVQEIVPSANPASRSVLVKVAIPKVDDVYPGMFGRIQIPLDPVQYLLIPKKAVRKVGQLELVSVKEDGKIVTRAVRTGGQWGEDLEILSGLSEGEDVVVESTEEYHHG